jgi:hypothetical protein
VRYPNRQRLPHDTPLGPASEEATFFRTICAVARGSDEFLRSDRAAALLWCALLSFVCFVLTVLIAKRFGVELIP